MRGPDFLDLGGGRCLACHRLGGRAPGVVFLGGFRSDMTGTKATALEAWARERGQAFVRFDYSGHGASSGDFEDGSIGAWSEDALAIVDALTDGPQILVGSSMGGWIALLLARARPERVEALTLIAPAPDFTERLMWRCFSNDLRQQILKRGRVEIPSAYAEEPDVITRTLIEEGRNHLLLDGPIPVRCRVRILHGQRDRDVPAEISLLLLDRLESEDVELTLVKSGDHRLSGPDDLARLARCLDALS